MMDTMSVKRQNARDQAPKLLSSTVRASGGYGSSVLADDDRLRPSLSLLAPSYHRRLGRILGTRFTDNRFRQPRGA